MIRLLNLDCFQVLREMRPVRMIFADPPDNIGLKYNEHKDKMCSMDYRVFMSNLIYGAVDKCEVFWLSYNAKHTYMVGALVDSFLEHHPECEAKPCVQVFTFGQHCQTDFGNNHRPLIRIMRRCDSVYTDAIRVPSWRQKHGDKRADPRGRVPGDVAEFERSSRKCRPLPNWSPSDIVRFLEKIDKKGEDDCWEWLASCSSGYGNFRIGGRGGGVYRSTRLMWRLTHGMDPMGELVLHTCDNPKCCNPAHLFLGSDTDNARDKESKGRGKHPKGEQQGSSKLNTEDVIHIYQSSDSDASLSKQYEVGRSTIWSIRNRKTWTHVTGDLELSDVFRMPRIVGNSKQRRTWHPTQLHEGLYERCIKSCCVPGDTVCDLFAGTGTLARVAERCGVDALLVDNDPLYCAKIAEEHNLEYDDD